MATIQLPRPTCLTRDTETVYSQLQLQLYLNLKIQQKIHWDWPAVSEAIRGRPGYTIYYKLDKYKEIRRYISTVLLSSARNATRKSKRIV